MESSTENINNTFFKGLYKEIWKKLMHPGLSKAECDFIIDVAKLYKGDKVLDIMCGHGRHALELAKRGMLVYAVDNLSDYIDEINATAEKDNTSIQTAAVNILEADFPGGNKAVVCMGNSFAFFNREEASVLLQKIAESLNDDGVFIINSWMIAEIAIRHFEAKQYQEVDGFKYQIDNNFCFYPSRIESLHTVTNEDGRSEVIKGVDYIFTLSELDEMFSLAGLKTVSVFSTPRKRKFSLGDSSVYIVVRKK